MSSLSLYSMKDCILLVLPAREIQLKYSENINFRSKIYQQMEWRLLRFKWSGDS